MYVTKSSRIRKNIKGKGYSITESLTALRIKKLTEACNSFGTTNVSTQDGKILCEEDNRIKVFLTNWKCSSVALGSVRTS